MNQRPSNFRAPVWQLPFGYPLADEEYTLRRDAVEAIIVHHTAGPEHQSVEQLRTYHVRPVNPPALWLMEYRDRWLKLGGSEREWKRYAELDWKPGRGWVDIGYHHIVRFGQVHAGRPEWAEGSHAPGWNYRSIGVALAGDYSKRPPGSLQLDGLRRLLVRLLREYPGAKVIRHDEAMRQVGDPGHTTCPGCDWLELVQNSLASAGFAL